MEYNVFDIETGPRPIHELVEIMPEFETPGNYKDPEKIKANIEEQQAKWIEKAALKAVSGEVIAIGMCDQYGNKDILTTLDRPEAVLIERFWNIVTSSHGERWVGFNSNGFDLPFLFQRSLALGIVPSVPWRAGRYWDPRFIDLMEVWGAGNKEYIGLGTLCKFLGIGDKSGSGEHFAETLKTDPESAIAYLKHDLDLTQALLKRMLPWIDGGES